MFALYGCVCIVTATAVDGPGIRGERRELSGDPETSGSW